ncbi:hypothetical protein CTI12_AA535390 [Artemisia annua]|uniref:Uncharacterized protein n=1 Tax=Artemisia annua TaxID=35608 RepID=A0A2U1L3A9_ARTAN|nr:hypothetical protein CTI12_AA535390 [Artemisia annua]
MTTKTNNGLFLLQSITFERFMVQAGSDFTGVATDMVTLNSTVKFTFRNTATFFGLHVTSTPLDLSFSQIAVGSGTIKKFYQKRKSQRLVTVSVVGDKVPLYGSGQGLKTLKGVPTAPVPLKLSFKVRSRGYVLGKLVKPKFYNKIECSVAYDPKKKKKENSFYTNDGEHTVHDMNNGGEDSDVAEVPETVFDESDGQKERQSKDPFEIYSLLNKDKTDVPRKVNDDEQSFKYPPGFTPDAESNAADANGDQVQSVHDEFMRDDNLNENQNERDDVMTNIGSKNNISESLCSARFKKSEEAFTVASLYS